MKVQIISFVHLIGDSYAPIVVLGQFLSKQLLAMLQQAHLSTFTGKVRIQFSEETKFGWKWVISLDHLPKWIPHAQLVLHQVKAIMSSEQTCSYLQTPDSKDNFMLLVNVYIERPIWKKYSSNRYFFHTLLQWKVLLQYANKPWWWKINININLPFKRSLQIWHKCGCRHTHYKCGFVQLKLCGRINSSKKGKTHKLQNKQERAIRDCRPSTGLVLCGVFWVANK